MFSQLASYLLGTSSNRAEQEATTSTGVDQINARLITVVSEDDDWVLVDRGTRRDSEGNSEVSSLIDTDDELLSNPYDSEEEGRRTRTPTPFPRLSSRSSSTASLNTHPMEESWFITPPPCFTSACPVVMQTSPLENLLIEHPSMSVYHQHPQPFLMSRRQAVPASPQTQQPVVVNDLIRLDPEDIVETPEVAQPRREPRGPFEEQAFIRVQRTNRVNIIQQQERQLAQGRGAQKLQIEMACQSLKRGYLRRNNKAREVNCRNQRKRRGERSQGANRSWANNNRKC